MSKKCNHIWEIKNIKKVSYQEKSSGKEYYEIIYFCKKCSKRKDDLVKSFEIK
jgi:hypothetical protein